MGEIGLQYEGLSPSDPSVDQYFALAEELDIPVAIHMGTGGSGRANITMPKFRGSMGNPLLLEELLARHPKLRVQVMHAGYPMIDNMLTLLQANSHVYVDVAGLIWSYPLKEVNRYIQRLVDAGFEDRVMFGTDQMDWPKLMAYSISIIQNADYLTPRAEARHPLQQRSPLPPPRPEDGSKVAGIRGARRQRSGPAFSLCRPALPAASRSVPRTPVTADTSSPIQPEHTHHGITPSCAASSIPRQHRPAPAKTPLLLTRK